MSGYKCLVCGANCAPGELVGGVCLGCLEEQRIAIVTQSKVIRLLNNAPWERMAFEGGISF